MPWSTSPQVPVSEVASRQFAQFCKVRDVLLADKAKEGRRRAALASRFRSLRNPEVGDRVMLRDPGLTKARFGHIPRWLRSW